MSGSTARIIAVLDALTAAESELGTSAQEIVRRSGVRASTGYRILSELQELGLVHRASHQRIVPNFTFTRRVRPAGIIVERLDPACEALSTRFTSSSEVVVATDHNLVWHIVRQHPDQPIRLRAHPGFFRGLYELDALSRIALAHRSIETIEAGFDTAAFQTSGVERRSVGWDEARRTIRAVDPDDMQFDIGGNAKGIRRFAVAVRGAGGTLACLLTVAEAATPLRDEAAHVATIRTRLIAQRDIITDSAGPGQSDIEPATKAG